MFNTGITTTLMMAYGIQNDVNQLATVSNLYRSKNATPGKPKARRKRRSTERNQARMHGHSRQQAARVPLAARVLCS